jgi:hypothetical protein
VEVRTRWGLKADGAMFGCRDGKTGIAGKPVVSVFNIYIKKAPTWKI